MLGCTLFTSDRLCLCEHLSILFYSEHDFNLADVSTRLKGDQVVGWLVGWSPEVIIADQIFCVTELQWSCALLIHKAKAVTSMLTMKSIEVQTNMSIEVINQTYQVSLICP